MMTVVAVVISMSAVPIERRPIIVAIVRIAIVGIRPIIGIRIISIITREPDSYTKPYASVSALGGNKSDYRCHRCDQENGLPVHSSTSLLFSILHIIQLVR